MRRVWALLLLSAGAWAQPVRPPTSRRPAHAVKLGAASCWPPLLPRRPEAETQLFTIWFREGRCGERWNATGAASSNDRCGRALALLREMDGAALRKLIGWPPVTP